MKVELSLEHAEILLTIGRDYRRICKLVETDCTTEQEEALGELKDECASVQKWRLRTSRLSKQEGEALVSYVHSGKPKSAQRYVQRAADPLPKWATDVRPFAEAER